MPIDNHTTEGRRPLTYQLQIRGGYGSATLTGTTQLTAKSSQLLRLDPGGANRNVDLPGPDQGIADNEGLVFEILNTADAAESLTVRNPAGGTVVTISQNEKCRVVGTGGTSWTHMGIQTIALT